MGALNRRTFVRLAGQMGLTGVALAGFRGLRAGKEMPPGMRGDLGILRPPGSVAEADFLAGCIRCTRCSDACESQCILLFGPEAGERQGTPYIQPGDRGCSLCLQCGLACPTHAIVPLDSMTEARMGVAVVDERLCVSHNGTGVCGACHTVCPLKNRAITQDFRNAPVVHADACAGCGLCQEACIVKDRRAIRVQSRRGASIGEEVRT